MNNKKTVRIRVVNEGQCFGHRGELVALNGRKLAETRIVPYGMRHVAYSAAEALAAEKGWIVRD